MLCWWEVNGRKNMGNTKRALILRNLHFWLSGAVADAEHLLQQVALDCDATRDEVYCEDIVKPLLYTTA
jgi:hypothetical protein